MLPDPLQTLLDFRNRHRTARNLVLKAASLRGLHLAGLRADGLDLEEADLRECSLAEVKWRGCILRDARLDAADFTDAILRMCDLDQARACDATFVRTRLENSTACGARFDRADLTGAVLTDTNFSRASLRDAMLKGASASGANFRGADLRGARLRDAVLVDADLRGACLTNADLTDADLQGADLRGADLRGVTGDVTGDNAALQNGEPEPMAELPIELKALTGTMAPIVLEVLHTAGRRSVIDPATAGRLTEEAAALHRRASPRNAPNAATLKAVSRVLEELGDDVVPRLIAALRQPARGDPPPEVMTLIRRLGQELSLDETATAEDILERLAGSRQKRAPCDDE